MDSKKKAKHKCRKCGESCGCYVPYKDCFFPKKEPRYIKCMVPFQIWQEDLKIYNTHLKRLFNTKCYVDTKPPHFDLSFHLQHRQARKDDDRCVQIDRENKNLLKKMIEICRKGGDTNTINPYVYRNVSQWKKNWLKMLEIDKENKRVHDKLVCVKSDYSKKGHSKDWKLVEERMKRTSKFPVCIYKKTSWDEILCAEPTISGDLEKYSERPVCFLEFQVEGGEYLGRIIVELYRDHVPVTVQNFIELLIGRSELSYKGCPVHRIVKDRFMETGDIIKGNGTGGFSIYGRTFDEENHRLKHTKAGVLSMVRIGTTEKNNSRFCITFMNMQEWDRKNVVFGKVIKGADVLKKLSSYGRLIGKPLSRIYISRCGLLDSCPCTDDFSIKCL